MTTYSPFELEAIFIDFKNESYNLGLDIQANQNDTLTLNFICRNNGIEEDMSKYKVELRVHNNTANVDYIQTQNENITLSADGSVKIVCQSLKGNKLTAYSGQCNGVLRIFNTENKQKATRIITMRIVADPLEAGKANICESTITKLEDLDWILNEAYNIEDEFKKAIEEAIKQKAELTAKISESVIAKNNLNSTTQTANNTNKTLTDTNTTAINTKNELNTLNNNAINTKSNLEKTNNTALATNKTLSDTNTGANNTNNTLKSTISDADKSKSNLDASKINADKSKIALDTSKSNADKSKSDLDNSISTGATLKNDIDNRLTTGNKLKTDLNNSSTVATTKKEQLDGANIQAEKNIETLNSFGDASQLTKDVTTLKTKVLENTLTSIETDSTLTKLDNCENGFVRNMLLRGKTLQNLVTGVVKTTEQFRNFCFSDLLKPNTTYTLIINNTSDTNYNCYFNEENFTTGGNLALPKGISIKKTTTKNTIVNNTLLKNFTGGNQSFTLDSIMLLEGEPKEIPPYFEGIKSTGELEGNKISILTTGKNLCSVPDGFTANIEPNKASGTDYYRVGNIPTGTRLKAYLTYKGNLVDVNGEVAVNFADRNKKSLGFEAFWKYPLTPIVKPNTYYIKIFWNEKVGKEITFDNIIITVDDGAQSTPNLIYKEDKTEILIPNEPLKGLPDGVSDVINFDKNERIRNVGKGIFDGSEDITIERTLANTISFYINGIVAFPSSKLICDKIAYHPNKSWFEEDEENIMSSSSGKINVKLLKSRLSTPDITGLKKYLQANPITVYYQLATPVVEKLNIKDTLQTFQDGYIQLDNAITPCTSLEYSTNIPSALGGLTQVTDKLVDEVTNVEITISDMDAEIGEARKNKNTLEERLEEDKSNILNKFNEYGKKDGTLQRNLNAEKLGGFNSNSFGKLYINPNEKDISDANSREFYVTNVTDNSNAPNDSWHHVINLPHTYDDGFTSQIAVSYWVNNNIYFRAADGTKWLPWKELATTETKVLTLLNGWQNFQEGMYSKVNKTGDVINVQLHIKGGLVTSGNVICNTGYNLGSYNFFQAYDAQGNFVGMVSCDTNGNITITKNFTQNNDVYINIHTIV